MKKFDDFTGRDANEIIENRFIDRSSWHIFQAKCWIDLAKRKINFSALHYSALELRYGVEYYLFELLVTSNPNITDSEYKRCLGKPKEMNKMLSDNKIAYEKLLVFTKIATKLDVTFNEQIFFWKLNDLFKIWGVASEFLHFCGSHGSTYKSKKWIIKSIARIESEIDKIFKKMTFALMNVKSMKPQVFEIWTDFKEGRITEENVENRLRLIQYIL